MKKLIALFSVMVVAMAFVGCDNSSTPDTPAPNTQKPTISVSPGEITEDSFTFTLTSDTAGTYAYYVDNKSDKVPVPDMMKWFEQNSGVVDSEVTITVEGLEDGRDYTLYTIVRANESNILSDVKKLEFTTLNIDNVIEVNEVNYNSVTFTINLDTRYVFIPVSDYELDYYNVDAATYLEKFNCVGNGVNTYTWINGSSYEGYKMNILPDLDYTIAVAECDSNKNIIGDVYTAKFRTPAKPQAEVNVEIGLSEITSTSVKITTTPDAEVAKYYVYVRDKAWFDTTIEAVGTSTLIDLLKSSAAGAWFVTSKDAYTDVWGGLTPSTVYNVAVVAVDGSDQSALLIKEFTTTEPTGSAPTLDVTLEPDATLGHETLTLTIKSVGAASIKYAFNTTADVDAERVSYDDSYIANNRGAALDGEQMAEAAAEGCVITLENLWPGAEYTVLVSARSAESLETLKVVSVNTNKYPEVARVESDLFETLVGEWTVSYSFIDYLQMEREIVDATVTIAAGVDDHSAVEYRAMNRLVILDWPFQHDYVENPFTTITPADLIAYDSYWADNPNLAYRDYGPKIFLQIDEGDVVTVPSAKNLYFYNEQPVGGYYLNFYGCDYENKKSAPASFPVTISDDGNTITIGACQSGAEFDYGLYRPSVFRNDSELRNVATSDIVLKRK